jgi:hypothetical protein
MAPVSSNDYFHCAADVIKSNFLHGCKEVNLTGNITTYFFHPFSIEMIHCVHLFTRVMQNYCISWFSIYNSIDTLRF